MAPLDGLDNVRRILAEDPRHKWGFVIYRCTYDDDAVWQKFMAHLNDRVRLNLEEEGNGELFDRLDWSVQEDPSLEGALVEDVRARFLEWTTAHAAEDDWMGTPRFHACVMVEKSHVEGVLEGPPVDEFDSWGEGSVVLVSKNEEEDMTFVGASLLVPHVYTLLENHGWDSFAVDPDEGDIAECLTMV